VIANTRKLRAITESKVKTDKVDASTLCELLAAGFLPAVFSPDEPTRALRRRLQRRAKLVRSRTRAKNECHAVLARNLKGKPPMSDIFGRKGRQWLAALELSADELETLEGCLHEVDFLDSEIALIERELAREALSSAEIRRPCLGAGVSGFGLKPSTFVEVLLKTASQSIGGSEEVNESGIVNVTNIGIAFVCPVSGVATAEGTLASGVPIKAEATKPSSCRSATAGLGHGPGPARLQFRIAHARLMVPSRGRVRLPTKILPSRESLRSQTELVSVGGRVS
jgi:hypothetical protein